MENIVFLLDNAALRGLITASGEASGFPDDNLLYDQRSVVWIQDAAGAATLDVTLDASEDVPIEAWALIDPNLGTDSSETLRVRAWSDAINGSTLVYDTNDDTTSPFNIWQPFIDESLDDLFTDDVMARIKPCPMMLTGLTTTPKYWRFDLAGSIVHQAGVIFLGSMFQPDVTVDASHQTVLKGRTNEKETDGGQTYTRSALSRKKLKFKLSNLSELEKWELMLRWLKVQDHEKILVCRNPDGDIDQIMSTIYGRIKDFDANDINYLFSGMPAEIIEDL